MSGPLPRCFRFRCAKIVFIKNLKLSEQVIRLTFASFVAHYPCRYARKDQHISGDDQAQPSCKQLKCFCFEVECSCLQKAGYCCLHLVTVQAVAVTKSSFSCFETEFAATCWRTAFVDSLAEGWKPYFLIHFNTNLDFLAASGQSNYWNWRLGHL